MRVPRFPELLRKSYSLGTFLSEVPTDARILNVGSENDRFRLGLHGQNLSDEEYRVGGYNFPGALFGNSVIGFYGPPMTVTGSVEVRF